MTEARSLSVQSVVYGTDPVGVLRAATEMVNSVRHARQAELIGEWSYQLGECTPETVFSNQDLAELTTMVESQSGHFSYTFFGENLGSAAGHNRLAAASTSDLILILNPDVQMGYDAMTLMCRSLRDGVGIVEARQLPIEHPKTYEKYTGETSWASTACALTLRAAFDTVGGFDSETFFLYCDDVDYSWRLRLTGYSVVFEPSARVYHDKRLSISGDWHPGDAEVYYSAEAALLLAHKYSRPGRVGDLLKAYGSETEPMVHKAVAEYVRRRAAGTLPIPIDTKNEVGQFIKGNYAEHRF